LTTHFDPDSVSIIHPYQFNSLSIPQVMHQGGAMLLSKRTFKILIWSVVSLLLIALHSEVEGETTEPRGEIRVVESFRPDINVLGHNVLQNLFEYALDRNELTPSLAVSREWIDDTTLQIRLRQGVSFTNGEPFDANTVKFNVQYQRQHNLGRGVQFYMKNLKEIHVIDPHTVRMILHQPDSLFLDKLILGPTAGWVIGAPEYMERVGWEGFLERPIGTGPYVVEGEVKDYREMPEGEV
jgi:ABC-type transport system substrate-binding protein